MKEIKINLNDDVKVKITEYGQSILKKYYENLNIMKYYSYQKPDSDGFSTFQLWELMIFFGDEMYNGNPHQVFVKNEIILIKKPSK
jgi:hypothetical protein